MKNFVVITLGTGLGSGFVIDGKLVYGHDGFAGEIGHTVIRPEHPTGIVVVDVKAALRRMSRLQVLNELC